MPRSAIKNRAALLLLTYALLPPSAHGTETLHFKHVRDGPATVQQSKIDTFLKEKTSQTIEQSSYLYAKTDLNADNIPEIILKEKNCEKQRNTCQFWVLADTQTNMIELGSINARQLTIGKAGENGIREIHAYTSGTNDFRPQMYTWSPQDQRYKMTGQSN